MMDSLKTALKFVFITTFAFACVAAYIVLMLSFTSPLSMADFTGQIGLYEQSAWYYSTQYERDGETKNIASAVHMAMRTEDQGLVAKYGQQLTGDENFTTYCLELEQAEKEYYEQNQQSYVMQERYEQYYYGVVCIAQYKSSDLSGALESVISATKECNDEYAFNAFTDLVYETVIGGDKEFARNLLTAANTLGLQNNANWIAEMITTLTAFTA